MILEITNKLFLRSINFARRLCMLIAHVLSASGFSYALVMAFILNISIFPIAANADVTPDPVRVTESSPKVSPILLTDSSKRTLKRKVAIARFSNETKYGQGFLIDKNADRIGKQAMDILSAKLTATDKFILLERADLDKINDELKIGGKGKLNLPADYLIVGSISEFGRKAESDVGIFSRTRRQIAFAKVNVRLVDVATGQVIYSEEGSGEAFVEAGTVLGVGGYAAYDSTLNDKAIDAAITKMVSNIVGNLLDKPWRAYVLAVQGDDYIISGGKSQGIRSGDKFNVYRKGSVVANPQTGMSIELPGSLIGSLVVHTTIGDTVTNEVSICRVAGGSPIVTEIGNYYLQQN